MPGNVTTRKRNQPVNFRVNGTVLEKRASDGRVTPLSQTRGIVIPGTQITVSEGHPFLSSDRKGVDDLGGDFFTSKQWAYGKPTQVSGITPVYSGYQGMFQKWPFLPIPLSTTLGPALFPPALNSSNSELDKLGATAISRCEPTNSVADVSTFLGELLKDGLPALVGATAWKDRTKTAKAAGGEYLNTQFGWLPIANDVKKFAAAVSKADKILAQYERDAGRVVRRRYNFPIKRESTQTQYQSGVPLWNPDNRAYMSTTVGSFVREREIVRRQWFSGAFTYTLPSGSDSRSKMRKFASDADKLFGISLTPDTLWNLAPWSWAVDWFSNTGDVIHNMSAFRDQGLVMRYGYIMEHTTVSDTYTCSGVVPGNSGSIFNGRSQSIAPITFVTETKVRRRANPFGFGVSWDGLSPFQASILAALGVTRR